MAASNSVIWPWPTGTPPVVVASIFSAPSGACFHPQLSSLIQGAFLYVSVVSSVRISFIARFVGGTSRHRAHNSCSLRNSQDSVLVIHSGRSLLWLILSQCRSLALCLFRRASSPSYLESFCSAQSDLRGSSSSSSLRAMGKHIILCCPTLNMSSGRFSSACSSPTPSAFLRFSAPEWRLTSSG